MNESATDSLARRQADPLWIKDYFLTRGHNETTPNASGTFVKRRGRYYVVTCSHVLQTVIRQRDEDGEKCDDVLYRTGKKINSSYSQELGFRDPLKINELLLQNADSLPSELMGKSLKFEYPRAVIESLSHKSHYFVSRGTLEIIKDGDKISIQEKRNFAGWEVLVLVIIIFGQTI